MMIIVGGVLGVVCIVNVVVGLVDLDHDQLTDHSSALCSSINFVQET